MVEAACESGGSDGGVDLPLRYLPAGFLTIREYCGDAVMWGLFTKFSGERVAPLRRLWQKYLLTLALSELLHSARL